MSNWHRDMDRKLQAQQEAEAKHKAAEEARQKKQQSEQRARERERQLRRHQRKYKCHICGAPSDGPTRHRSIWMGEAGDRYVEYDSWADPAGLQQCSICGKWACCDGSEDPHIHGPLYRRVCKRCYNKGYLPGDRRKWWDLLIGTY
jgi:hypothetical protein